MITAFCFFLSKTSLICRFAFSHSMCMQKPMYTVIVLVVFTLVRFVALSSCLYECLKKTTTTEPVHCTSLKLCTCFIGKAQMEFYCKYK